MSPVVGRDSELESLERFLAEVGSMASAITIVGEPGIGKTTLWEDELRLARERGAAVLASRPTEAEARLSFAGLSDLLAAAPQTATARLPAPQRVALDVALLRAETTTPPDSRLLGTALVSLVRELTTAGEVIVGIDDVQWFDPASSAVVGFALRRLWSDRVRVFLSMRTGTESMLIRALPPERMELLELGPLSVGALHRIIKSRLGRSLPRPTIVRIAEMTDGNPFYALEVARLVSDDPGLWGLPVPSAVRNLVRDRIRSLPTSTRHLLLRAATAARPDLDLLEASSLAAIEEIGLVTVTGEGRIVFAHPLYASAVYASAPLAERQDAHRELAQRVRNPEERARHLALATPEASEEVAASVATAARLAHARGAPLAAAELMYLALQRTPVDSPDAHERRLELAEYLELAGDLDGAERLVDEVCNAAQAGDLLARALLLRSGLVYRRSGESDATVVAQAALAAAVDPLLRARCQAVLSGWIGTVDAEAAAAAARSAVEALEQSGTEPALLSFALANLVRATLFNGDGFDREAAERALDLERAAPPAAVDDRVVYRLGQWLRYVDDYEGARRHLAEAEEEIANEGDESSSVNVLLNRLVLELWAGAWPLATEISERLIQMSDQLGVPHIGRLWRSYVDAHLGDLASVDAAALAADRSDPVTDMLYLRSLGLVELSASRFDEANRGLRHAVELIERAGTREPAIWRVEGDAIEAALGVGDVSWAEARTTSFERQAARSAIPWSLAVSRRCRGLVLAAHGEVEAAAQELEEALAAHERCPAVFEHARTLLAVGRVRRRLKQKRLARIVLEDALARFSALGADLWAERSRAELRRVRTRRSDDMLTATEHEIADLAASGLTNQAIAERVFVSRKTVEANLRRAYKKLGISSRAQLREALDRSGS